MDYNHILSYIGGKFYIADWIISHFPKHICYVEIFGGAAHVLLRKQKAKVEVYNDINKDLVNLFIVAKNQPDILYREVDSLPYARSLYQDWLADWKTGFKGTTDLEWAVRYFYLANCAFSGKFGAGFSVGVSHNQTLDYYNGCKRINGFTRRMKECIIENLSYEEIIKRYDSPDTLFYADPPYVDCEHYYKVTNQFNESDHRKLAELLNHIQGKALVSYYPSSLVDELYPKWIKYTIEQTKHSVGIVANSNITERPKSTELLLSNSKVIRMLDEWS